MKGITKAFQRAPHLITTRVGMGKSEYDGRAASIYTVISHAQSLTFRLFQESSDSATDALTARFTGLEGHINK